MIKGEPCRPVVDGTYRVDNVYHGPDDQRVN